MAVSTYDFTLSHLFHNLFNAIVGHPTYVKLLISKMVKVHHVPRIRLIAILTRNGL